MLRLATRCAPLQVSSEIDMAAKVCLLLLSTKSLAKSPSLITPHFNCPWYMQKRSLHIYNSMVLRGLLDSHHPCIQSSR